MANELNEEALQEEINEQEEYLEEEAGNENEQQEKNEKKVRITIQKPNLFLDENEYKQRLVTAIKENNASWVQNISSQLETQNMGSVTPEAIDDYIYKTNIQEITSTSRNAFVNGDLETGYNQLLKFCLFNPAEEAYMQYTEGDNLSQKIPTYVTQRLGNLPSFKGVVDLGNCVYDIMVNDGDVYQANLSYTKLCQIEDQYSDEEKAKLNFIASKMFLNISELKGKGLAGLNAQGNELECLNKVLNYTSDYNLIVYSQKRLSPKNDKLVVRAYKHALENNNEPQNLYNICMALSDIYARRGRAIGFVYEGGEKSLSLQKAQRYLMNAYRYASPDNRLNVLKKLSSLQLEDGNTKGWENTKTVIAYKFLKGEERCFALNAIGDKVKNVQYYQMALEECDKASLPEPNKRNIKEITYGKMIKLMPEGQEKQQAIQTLNKLRKENMLEFNSLLLLLGNDKQK